MQACSFRVWQPQSGAINSLASHVKLECRLSSMHADPGVRRLLETRARQVLGMQNKGLNGGNDAIGLRINGREIVLTRAVEFGLRVEVWTNPPVTQARDLRKNHVGSIYESIHIVISCDDWKLLATFVQNIVAVSLTRTWGAITAYCDPNYKIIHAMNTQASLIRRPANISQQQDGDMEEYNLRNVTSTCSFIGSQVPEGIQLSRTAARVNLRYGNGGTRMSRDELITPVNQQRSNL